MGKRQRDIGLRFERKVVNLARDAGHDTYRVPLSGAAEGFKGDVIIKLPEKHLTLECKNRQSGFKFLYDNLEGVDALVVQQKFKEPLAVMPYSFFLELIGGGFDE